MQNPEMPNGNLRIEEDFGEDHSRILRIRLRAGYLQFAGPLFIAHVFIEFFGRGRQAVKRGSGGVINIYTRTYNIAGIVRWAGTGPGTAWMVDGF